MDVLSEIKKLQSYGSFHTDTVNGILDILTELSERLEVHANGFRSSGLHEHPYPDHLIDCPFCGSSGKSVRYTLHAEGFIYSCGNCGVSLRTFPTHYLAREAWNRRYNA